MHYLSLNQYALKLRALAELAGMLDDGDSRQRAFGYSVIVSWGELTSSKLLAQSYEKAGKQVLITDH